MTFPSRFAAIVGAPRCGTTALSRYLGQHPDVCFSDVKEPHFFIINDLTSLDLDELKSVVGEGYLDRFFPNCGEDKLLMEGSVSYLYGSKRMRPILKLWPDAKFIIAVRDPFEMLPSVHQRMLYNGDETVSDFATAWALIPERRAGRQVPRTCVDRRFLDYEEAARFATHVEHFFEVVGRERCFVSVYDDLAADPSAHYRRLLAFLGLPDDGHADFRPRRPTQGFKIGWLQRLLKRPPKITQAMLAGEKFRKRIKSPDDKKDSSPLIRGLLWGRKRLLDWNKKPARKVPLSPELQQEIRRVLADDVERLSQLLGRDLSHWLGGDPKASEPTR
jgi:hypothetical protein